MDIITRAKNMITTPKTEWDVIAAEQPVVNSIIMGYVVPLALIGAAAAFIGYGLIGFSILGVRVASISWGIFHAVTQLIIGIASVFLTALVVDALAPSFGSEKDFGRSVQLVAYGATPGLIAAIFSVLPMIAGLLSLAGGIYSIYLWYLGIGPLKKTPEDKKVVYLIVIFVILLCVYFIIGMVLGLILMPILGLSYGLGVGSIHL